MNNVVFINNKVFGKQHKHILELISEKFNNSEIKNFCEPNFRLSFKTRKIEGFRGRERKYPYYQLTKDGFSFIAMGLTGRKADKFKIAFINAFNEIENIARSNNPTANYSDYEFIKKQNEILNQITCTQNNTIYVLQDSIRFLNNTISSMKEINKELKKILGMDKLLRDNRRR